MKKLFRHISSQPKAKRDSYAFMVAGTFTGIVTLIWAFSLPGKMGTVGETPEADSPAPFANLIKETGEQLAAVREGLKSKKSELSPETAASSTAIVLSPEEVSKAKEALESNNTEAISSGTSTTMAVPVMIATTTATTSYAASSTP